MKRVPLPFDFEGKGAVDVDLIFPKNQSFLLQDTFCGDFSSSNFRFSDKNRILEGRRSFGEEPTSVLDSTGIPSRPTSSSTPSSSGGGGGDGGAHRKHDSATATSASNAVAAPHQVCNTNTSQNVVVVGGHISDSKFAIEEWESVLSGDVSPGGQEPSELRWITTGGGGGEDPYNSDHSLEFDFSGGFGAVDRENFCGLIPIDPPILDHKSTSLSPNLAPNFTNLQNFAGFSMGFEESKPPAATFSSELFISHHQAQSHHLSFLQQPLQIESSPFLQPPPPKRRHNPVAPEISKGSFSIEPNRLSNNNPPPNQLQFLTAPQMGSSHNFLGQPQQQQSMVTDQLFKAAESIQTGNSPLAHAILARLNHLHVSEPFHRAALYCKETLLQLAQNGEMTIVPPADSPLSLVLRIGASKSFSEASPVVQFASFTCNQAILEAVEGLGRVRIVDFDIGFGGQWPSLMQELALNGGVSLKITVIPSMVHGCSLLELGLARENLTQFARDVNLPFDFEVLAIDSFPFYAPGEDEGVVVNLPAGVLAGGQFPGPAVLRFVKQLSPRLVVSVDRGCDRTNLPFSSHVVHAVQHFSSLVESLVAANVDPETLQKIERFLLRPGIEGILSSRFRSMEKAQHWRALLLSSGFSQGCFSNFAESLAESVVRRSHVRGFTVEKRQSCLVLCWQRKELVSVSAWRC